MKLLLLSLGLGAVPEFIPAQAKLGFIPTAGNVYADPSFVRHDRARLVKLGYQITDIDLDELTPAEIQTRLGAIDAVYVAGGNSFYLLQQLHQKDAADTLRRRVQAGLPYIGSSAGAIILGPSLEPVSSLDDPAEAPLLTSTKGLGLISFVPLPHYGKKKYLPRYQKILDEYRYTYQLVTYKDDQALLLADPNAYQMIESI
ncbi:MAG: hypothetical protein JWN01_621 [Patescibacteria group bacterium]|nr:hypothetical protein [Patescibacteria group bacterium]